MKFRIRDSKPSEPAEPKIEVWLELSENGMRVCVAEVGVDESWVVVTLMQDGTIHRPGVPSHLGFKLDSEGRIVDSTSEASAP